MKVMKKNTEEAIRRRRVYDYILTVDSIFMSTWKYDLQSCGELCECFESRSVSEWSHSCFYESLSHGAKVVISTDEALLS